MRKAALVLLFLLLINVASILVEAQTDAPLITKNHYGVQWLFYEDKVVVYDPSTSERIVLSTLLMNSRLSKWLGAEVRVYEEGNKVIYVYSVSKKIGLKTIGFTVKHEFVFAQTPAVKLRTIVDSNTKILTKLSKLLTYRVYYELKSPREFASKIKGKRLFFDWHDMVKSKLSFTKSKSANSLSLDVDFQGSKLIIDPTIGYSEGITTTEFYVVYDDFRSGSLDSSLWGTSRSYYKPSTGPRNPDTIEYGVSVVEGGNDYVAKIRNYMSGKAEPGYFGSTQTVILSAQWNSPVYSVAACFRAVVGGSNRGYGYAYIEIYDGSSWITVWSSTSESGTWRTFEYNSETPFYGLRFRTYTKILTEDGFGYAQADMYVDYVLINKTLAEGHYWAYSDSNATYAFFIENVEGGEGFKVPITIAEQSGTDLSDYQVKITLNSSNFDGWDKVQQDGSDIYFTDSSNNPLYYWFEYFNVTEQKATIWVEVPQIPANGETTIYMYYGGVNPYSSYHDPSKVFVWWEDAEEWSGWGVLGSGNVYQDSSKAFEGTHSIRKDDNCDPNGGYKDLGITIDRSGYALIYRAYRQSGSGTDCYADRVGIEDASGNGYTLNLDHTTPYLAIDRRDSGSATVLGKVTISDNLLSEWYMAELVLLPDKVVARVYDANQNLIGETSTTDTAHTSFARFVIRGGRPYYVDEIRIRKYVDPEPTVAVGSSSRLGKELYVLIPKGHDVLNVTRSDGNLTNFLTLSFNDTHFAVCFSVTGDHNYTVYSQAWNAVYDLYANYTYYPHNANVTVYAILKDPYGNPITDQNVYFYLVRADTNSTVQTDTELPDANGNANATLTLLSQDMKYYVQCETNGSYAGLKYIVIYSTDIAFSYSVPDNVTKNISFNYTVKAWLTVDNSPVSTLVVNGTSYSSGEVTLSFTYNESGHHSFYLEVSASKDAVSKNDSFSKTIFVGGSVNWKVTKDPNLYYYLPGSNVSITIDLVYDNGERCSNSIYVYYNNSLYASGSPILVFNVAVTELKQLYIANYTDLDGRTYSYTIEIYQNVLIVTQEVKGSLDHLVVNVKVRPGVGVIGRHKWAFYLLQPLESNEYIYDVSVGNEWLTLESITLKQIENTVDYDLVFINYRDKDIYLNVTVSFTDGFRTIASEAHANIRVLATNIKSVESSLTLNLSRDAPVYLIVTFESSEGDSFTYSMLTPINRHNLAAVYFKELDSNGTEESMILNVKDNVDTSKDLYSYIACVNGLGVTPDPDNPPIIEVIVPESLTAKVTLNVPNQVFETGNKASLSVTVEVSTNIEYYVKVYVNNQEYFEKIAKGNSTTHYILEVPPAPTLSLTRIPIEAEARESFTGYLLGKDTKELLVYNVGPTIILNSPAEGSTLSNITIIDLTVRDSSGVRSVKYRWDIEPENAWHNISEPYDIEVDTLKYPNGLVRLIVVAEDSNGYVSSETFTFNIYNPVKEAALSAMLESVATWFSRYMFIPALATAAVVMLIGYVLGKWRASKPKQPIIIRVEKGGKVRKERR